VALVGAGLDPAVAAVRPPLPDLPRFLVHVGAQQRHKNVPRLVRVFRRVADENVYLLLVGGDHNDTAEVARASAGDPRVIRLRSITDPQLAWLYEHAVGLAFPSLYEGFGMPVLDAMTRGCPVITSDRAALPEVAGDAALIVDPLDEAALEEGMRSLLNDAALRGRLVEAGRRRAAQLTWAAAAEATVGAYARAITER
jgi:glycosyltransferase involved in cell wall biosynthesis